MIAEESLGRGIASIVVENSVLARDDVIVLGVFRRTASPSGGRACVRGRTDGTHCVTIVRVRDEGSRREQRRRNVG